MRLRLALLLGALGLGCGPAADPAATVELWAMGREGEVVAAMLGDFEAAHPGVRVRVQQVPWSAAHEKLLTAYVGGALPDVFQAGTTWIAELVALGALEPLDARIAASTTIDPADWFPGVLAGNVVEGRTWGVPWYVDTRLLFYRSDLLAAAGFDAPPRTWAEWLAAMEAVEARAAGGAFAILLPLGEWEVPVILALQQGATLLRDDDTFGAFQSPAAHQAFAFYVELFRRGLAPVAGATAVANVYQDFAAGWFSFYVTGPWNLGEMAARLPASMTGRWATAPLPAPDGHYPGVSLAGGASLVVARTSPRQDAAWQVVEWLSAPAQQVRFHALSGDLPARRAAWRQAGLADAPHTRAFWLQLDAVRPPPRIPEWERIADRIAYWAERAVRGSVGLDAALAALDRDVDAALAKRRWLLAREAGDAS